MKKITVILFFALTLTACKKLIEVGSPQNQLTTDKVFSDTTSAVAALGSIYAQLDKTIDPNYSIFMDLYADDLDYTGSSTQSQEFYRSDIATSNSQDLTIWQNLYALIYQSNDLITQLPISRKIPQDKVVLLGSEAKFLRAYAYFYLVNIYGSVPLVLTTDVNANASAKRTDISVVYQQIIEDLSQAEQGLPASYLGSGRIRANKWAASAMLARVYLFQQNWAEAESEATKVIGSGMYTPLASPDGVFLAGSQEAILQIWTQNGFISGATDLIPPSDSELPLLPVSSSLYQAFEPGDLRKSNWIGTTIVPGGNTNTAYYYEYKYKNRVANPSSPEYLMALRIGEQYLIRAEARAQQGKITGSGSAGEDLNIIRVRAGLPNTAAATQSTMLAAISRERRTELFGEWGNRFLDLKRSGQLDAVLGAHKTTWLPRASQLPLPQNELTYDHNLVQNNGY